MLSSPEVAGRLLKWRFKLEGHDIHYRTRTSVKGHMLADFIVERLEDDLTDTPMKDKEELPEPFHATNNEAEYEALIGGLRIAEQMRVKNLQANVDSKLVANQVNETYVAKETGMIKYLEKVKNLASTFKEFSIKQVPRGENKKADVQAIVEEKGHTWMTPIYDYLTEEILPEEKRKARSIRRKAAGPFPKGPSKVKFLIVAIDYFTKWIEAKLVVTITGAHIKKFVWDNIVCRFGLPGEIISDNEKQFRDNPFKDWCGKLCNRQCIAFIKHPQDNSLVERENRSLGEGIKAWLNERSKNWMEEVLHVLWAHRTMIKSNNRETPFSLTYGTEAVITVEIDIPTLKAVEVDMIKNNEALKINLDLLEEKREQATIQKVKSKAMKNTIMQRSATQVSSQETSSTRATKQAMQKREASSNLSGKDHTRSRKH
uniref:Reverse transcriptase domain-containing protein n=1 Tax=Tanacetum cinerariifolium TaxID=118510 RepID=A0A699GN24_TANCI|nr:reverse transcriptase domain-containing protein [Tanacetum cinerariifolium]